MNFASTMHNQFKMRAREMPELKSSNQSIAWREPGSRAARSTVASVPRTRYRRLLGNCSAY